MMIKNKFIWLILAMFVLVCGQALAVTYLASNDMCMSVRNVGQQGCQAGYENYCDGSGCTAKTGTSTPGWTPATFGWSVDNVANMLIASKGSYNVLYSDTFDIKADTKYRMSFSTKGGCSLTLSFDGNCTSKNNVRENCNFKYGPYTELSAISSTEEFTYPAISILIKSSDNATNGLYFRDVRLQLISDCRGHINDMFIKGISLREENVAPVVQSAPSGVLTSGCCPSDYCWNGTSCVNSVLWMNDPQKPPVWNSIFEKTIAEDKTEIDKWPNAHVNASSVLNSTGYRCVTPINSNNANWIPSVIKYDWDFKSSGYCANITDCYVGNVPITLGEGDPKRSSGCVASGSFVKYSDSGYAVDVSGTHYCYMGNWTTKSYVVAKLLQDISERYSYTLHCNSNSKLAYDLSDESILASCTIMRHNGAADNVITGVIVDTTDTFLTNLNKKYETNYARTDAIYSKVADCTAIADSDFSNCVNSKNVRSGTMFVYYNNVNNYFLISTLDLQNEIGVASTWSKIVIFFRNTFVRTSIINGFNDLSYSTSYDNIYVMRNLTGLNVTAIDETKYDESMGKIANTMLIKYDGTTLSNNPVDSQLESMLDDFNGGNREVNIVHATSDNPEIYVKSESDSPTGLWQYLTSMLRDKP
jgi:hypothetical protein